MAFQINQEFYDSLDKKIDSIPTQEEAEKFIVNALDPIQKQAQDMIDKVWTPVEKKLSPYLAYFNLIQSLASPPTSIDAVIGYLKKVASAYTAYFQVIKTEIQPYLEMYDNATAFIGTIPPEITRLQSHLKEKITEKGWDIDVPDIPIPTIPPLPPIPPILKE